jgi:protein gp37
MADKTKIQWADATINPAYGCTKCSPGCDHCYAETMASRNLSKCYAGLTEGRKWTGRVNLFPERMEEALKWKRPRRIFVGSMTDLFHKSVPFDFLDSIFAVMALAWDHTFMLLTKRPERMLEYFNSCPTTWSNHLANRIYSITGSIKKDNQVQASIEGRLNHSVGWPMRHVHLGVTVCNQAEADAKIPILLATPAAKRFVSVEPMLGSVNVSDHLEVWPGCGGGEPREDCEFCSGNLRILDWVICGGESGPGARPMHPDWARSLRDQCQAAGTPFFFKQWGEWAPGERSQDVVADILLDSRGEAAGHIRSVGQMVQPEPMSRVGKRRAGRLLDGIEWNEFPS